MANYIILNFHGLYCVDIIISDYYFRHSLGFSTRRFESRSTLQGGGRPRPVASIEKATAPAGGVEVAVNDQALQGKLTVWRAVMKAEFNLEVGGFDLRNYLARLLYQLDNPVFLHRFQSS